MKELSEWILEHNPAGRGRYILSLIEMVSFFVILSLYLCNCGWNGGWLWVILAGVISWDAGRYCLNRFLYITGPELLDGQQAVSRVLRFHAFDVEEYFAKLRKRLCVPALMILACVVLCAGAVWFDGSHRVSGMIVVCLTGLVSLVMVCGAYLIKKWQINREMQRGEEDAMGVALQISSKIFSVVEVLGIIVVPILAIVFLWVVMKSVVQPSLGEADIIYRSYAESYDLLFILLGVAAFIAGIVQSGWKWFRKLIFLFCAVCIVIGGVMIYLQNGNYTEIEGGSFHVITSGQRKEYTLEEVESFCVNWSDRTEGIQLTITFRDGEVYEVLGNDTAYNHCYEKTYHSEYDFVGDYASQMLRQGTKGMLEDRQKLEKHVQGLDQRIQEDWKEILELPFSK